MSRTPSLQPTLSEAESVSGRPHTDMGYYGESINGSTAVDINVENLTSAASATRDRLQRIQKRLNAKGVCSEEENAIRARSILLSSTSSKSKDINGSIGSRHNNRKHSSTPSVVAGGSRSQFLDKLEGALSSLGDDMSRDVDAVLDVKGLAGYYAEYKRDRLAPSLPPQAITSQRSRSIDTTTVTFGKVVAGRKGAISNSTSGGSVVAPRANPAFSQEHPQGSRKDTTITITNVSESKTKNDDFVPARSGQNAPKKAIGGVQNSPHVSPSAPSLLYPQTVSDVFQRAKQTVLYPEAEAQLRAHLKRRSEGSSTNPHPLSQMSAVGEGTAMSLSQTTTPSGPVARYLRNRTRLGKDGREVTFSRVGEGIPVGQRLTAHDIHGRDPAVCKEGARLARLRQDEEATKLQQKKGRKRGGDDDDDAERNDADVADSHHVELDTKSQPETISQPEEGDLLYSKATLTSLVQHAETTLQRRLTHRAEAVGQVSSAATALLAPKAVSLINGFVTASNDAPDSLNSRSKIAVPEAQQAELRDALQRSNALQAVFLAESDSDEEEFDDEAERNLEELIETGDARRKRRRDIRAAVLLGMLSATGGDPRSENQVVSEADLARAGLVLSGAASGTGIPRPLDAGPLPAPSNLLKGKGSAVEVAVTPEEALEDICDLLECCVVAFCQYLHRNTFLAGQEEVAMREAGGGGRGLFSPSYTGPPKDIGVLRGVLVHALSSSLPELKVALQSRDSIDSKPKPSSNQNSKRNGDTNVSGSGGVFSGSAATNVSMTSLLFNATSGGQGSSHMTSAMRALLDGKVAELRFRFLRSWTKGAETLLSLDLKHHSSSLLAPAASLDKSSPFSTRGPSVHWDEEQQPSDSRGTTSRLFKFSSEAAYPAAIAHERLHKQTRVPPSFFMVQFDDHLLHAASYYCSLHRRRIARSRELLDKWKSNKEAYEAKVLHGAAVNPFFAELNPNYLDDIELERLGEPCDERDGMPAQSQERDNQIYEARAKARAQINGMIDFFTATRDQLSHEDLGSLDFNSANLIHKQRKLVGAFLEKLIPKLKQHDDFTYTGTVEGKILARVAEASKDSQPRTGPGSLTPSSPEDNKYNFTVDELITLREGGEASREALSVLQRALLKVKGSKAARAAELFAGAPRNELEKQRRGGYSLAEPTSRQGKQVSRFAEIVMRYANLNHEDFDTEEFDIKLDDPTESFGSPTATSPKSVNGEIPEASSPSTHHQQQLAQTKFMNLFRSSWGRSPLDPSVSNDEAAVRSQVLEDALLVRVLDAYFYLLSPELQGKLRRFVQQAKRRAEETAAAEERDQALTQRVGSKVEEGAEPEGLRILRETLGAQLRDKYSNNDSSIERRFQQTKAHQQDLADRLRAGDKSVISDLLLQGRSASVTALRSRNDSAEDVEDKAQEEKVRRLHKLLNSTDSWFKYENNKRLAFDALLKQDALASVAQGGGVVEDSEKQVVQLLTGNMNRPSAATLDAHNDNQSDTSPSSANASPRPKNETSRLKRLHELEACWRRLLISHSQRIALHDKWATMRVEGRLLDRATVLYKEATARVAKREEVLEGIVDNEKRLLVLVPGGKNLLGAIEVLHSGSANSRIASTTTPQRNNAPLPKTKKECELLRHKLFAELTQASQECDAIAHRLRLEVGDDLLYRDALYLSKMATDTSAIKELLKRSAVAV